MSCIGYVIIYRPYTWEEDTEGNMYHNHSYFPTHEFFIDEIEFNERVADLQTDERYIDEPGYVWDGVDIDEMYWCELHRITNRG